VRLGNDVPWGTFRDVFDVFEVDGQKLRDRERRLEALFGAAAPPTAAEQSQAIVAESARYNVGPAVRSINFPTLALAFLLPANQPRFAWKTGGTRRFGTAQGVEVQFDETARPTIVRWGERADLPARGRFWIDPARGTVLRSETTFRFEPDRARASVTTQYRAEPPIALWVPAEMHEEYADLPGDAPVFRSPTRAQARYSNFRRFTVSIEDVTARVAGDTTSPPPAEAPPAEAPPAAALPTGSITPPSPPSAPAAAEIPSPVPPVSSPQASAAPPAFPSQVELITVDAVVLDRAGRPVSGLTKDDFEVEEDGKGQDVPSSPRAPGRRSDDGSAPP